MDNTPLFFKISETRNLSRQVPPGEVKQSLIAASEQRRNGVEGKDFQEIIHELVS